MRHVLFAFAVLVVAVPRLYAQCYVLDPIACSFFEDPFSHTTCAEYACAVHNPGTPGEFSICKELLGTRVKDANVLTTRYWQTGDDPGGDDQDYYGDKFCVEGQACNFNEMCNGPNCEGGTWLDFGSIHQEYIPMGSECP